MDRFEEIVRSLATTPSRRAINRAVLGLTVGTFLAPLMDAIDAAAKNGKKPHKRKEHRRKKRKKNKSDRCPKEHKFCKAGEFSECCSTAIGGVSGKPFEKCTACGCCSSDFTKCCNLSEDGLCCHDTQKCCYSDNLKTSTCCDADDQCCGDGCCNNDDVCCQTTGGVYYCCAGSLSCKKTGGFTCI